MNFSVIDALPYAISFIYYVFFFLIIFFLSSKLCGGGGVSHSVMSNSLQPHELYSPPCSSVHGILQARILEWIDIPFMYYFIFTCFEFSHFFFTVLHFQKHSSYQCIIIHNNLSFFFISEKFVVLPPFLFMSLFFLRT